MIQPTPFRIISLTALLTAALGCPGSLQDPARFSQDATTSCPNVPEDVFLKDCATTGCHTSTTKAQGLDLQSPGVASRLVGVAATEGAGLLIDPSSPSSSVIYTKLTATPPFGSRMPSEQAPLDDATIACVLAWVTAQTSGADASTATPEASMESGVDAETPPPADDSSSPPGDDGPAQSPPGDDSSVQSPPADDASDSVDADDVNDASSTAVPDVHVRHPRDASQ
jgi:hypothetical protein